MPTKKALIVVATVLGALVGYFFKETYWAVVIEASVDNFAHSLGMGRPELIGAAAPYLLSLVVCYALVAIAYALGTQALPGHADPKRPPQLAA